ncbi:MAG: bifunctional UDP-sugar hydrolase/5'-nucleotidase [Clostridiales bacterium]|nr:bifunctional UDP-sugar hydrolase/5'-nucleotidase [Clostridiales bacterium]
MSKNLKINFTSDVHGYFYPTSYGDRLEKDMGLFKCYSGFDKDENTLCIDGGDILQGSAFVYYCKSVLNSNRCVAEIMNACGYDYITVGNHDFNYGVDYLKEYVEHFNGKCVCQNILNNDCKEMFPYDIKVMPNGLRVGIIGMVTDYVNIWEKEENIKGVRITDPFVAARKALQECKNQVDVTIGIYHGGFENDLTTGELLSDSTENVAYRICQELDFDVLLTGHQHMSIDGQKVNKTFVVQSCEYAREYQCVELTFEDGELTITSKRKKATLPADEQLCKKFQSVEDQVQSWLEAPIGRLNRDLMPDDKIKMALHGSPIADFLNQVQFFFSNAQVSSVGLANEIAGFNREVKTRDIIATYPYPNTLVVVEITGAALKLAMERSAEYFAVEDDGSIVVSDSFLKPKAEHYNYDYYAGVDYKINPTNPIGSRIENLSYQGEPVKETDKFSICLNNYRYSGAGGYPMYPKCPVLHEINIDMVELIMDFFMKHPVVEV